MYPFKVVIEEILPIKRKGESRVIAKAETGVMWPQAKEWQ